jgi:integrase/recombinase XerD
MLFRRHIDCCPHRNEGRAHRRCRCPIWFDGTINGRRVLKSMQTTDWEKAQELEHNLITAGVQTVRSETPAPTPKEEPVLLEQAWEKYLTKARKRNLSPATIYKYDLLHRQMCSFAQRRGLSLLEDIKLGALEDFQGEWTEGPLARLKKLERLKGFFRAATNRDWLSHNPAKHLEAPKFTPRPTLPFDHKEMKSILEAVSVYPDKTGKTGRANAIRLRAFILTLRYTGLRIGDVTSLTVDRLAGNKIFLYTQKTGLPVNCVVPKFVAEELENVPRLSERYFFWTGNSTLHTAIGSWQRTLRKLFKRVGIRGYAHRFRDTFAVELLLAGVPTEEVAVLLGHNNIKITQDHYSPWVRSRQQQLEANLERAWKRDPFVLLNMKNTQEMSSAKHQLPN